MIFDHEPWELNDCFSADRSKIIFTSTLKLPIATQVVTQ
jgi:hypothetical protein